MTPIPDTPETKPQAETCGCGHALEVHTAHLGLCHIPGCECDEFHSPETPETRQVPMLKWQPMDSAPTDGRSVLLSWPYWSALRPVIGWWQVNGGWQCNDMLEGECEPPVAWMPLPLPHDPPSSSPREPQKDETPEPEGCIRCEGEQFDGFICDGCGRRLVCWEDGSFSWLPPETEDDEDEIGEPREPHAALIAELQVTILAFTANGCDWCDHPKVTGGHENEQHYNDCLFFTLRRCLLALKGA